MSSSFLGDEFLILTNLLLWAVLVFLLVLVFPIIFLNARHGSFAINVIIISLVFFYSFRKLVNDLIFTILGLLLAEIELDLVQVEVN